MHIFMYMHIYLLLSMNSEPSAPRYSCILGESSDGIELNWIPPLEPNGDVYYLIDDGNRTVNTSSGSTYFNLTGLQRGVTYNITVVAMNSAGRSDTGSVLYYTYNVQSKYLSICDGIKLLIAQRSLIDIQQLMHSI